MARLSVIMASYQHAPFVREAIDSVLTQSYRDLELVITDDGSRDGTPDVIRAVRDPRLRFHALPQNRGACVAVNDTIERAGGEYLALLNSDDYFLPGKLERQVAFLDSHPEIGAVFGRPLFVDEGGKPFRNALHVWAGIFAGENRSRQDWLKYFFYEGNGLCHPTIMVRKSCYERVGRFDPLLMQLPDLDMWIRLCAEYEIHLLPEPLTAFRILDRERNTSAPSKERLARSGWETGALLRHYAGLPEADLRTIFSDSPDAGAPGPARLVLARAALRVGKPGYAQFGLGLLQDSLRRGEEFISMAEYFKLVGEYDPYGAEFYRREFRYLRKSRLVHGARTVAKWWRNRNFHG